MLEDLSIHSIVRWGPMRDCFIVNNLSEFSKTVLPRIFRHSNFASFVRQLNKYDFHKINQTEFNQAGEQTPMFRHRYFHGDRPGDLKNIKRKLIANGPALLSSQANMVVEIAQCAEDNEDMKRRIRGLESDQDAMRLELDRVGSAIALRNEQMQDLKDILGALGGG
ncbi:hypothetical protein GALMADRAFT_709408 [Galerina marginata CBS 339.88]|uniref:HSF-type DNA-binding domain-containing protein n=1 Tax=Galerina marginata (strain CBS 339.88) TaxID=685588 RepID=A0A067TZ61_GALM3|nr:hypothetical protein GALMADRAFT_709408 [Galerina marginata CBS 339.88]